MTAAAKLHAVVSLVMLLIFCGLCAAVDYGAQSHRVADWLDGRLAAKCRANDRPIVRSGNFSDYFDTLMLGTIPHADYSRGGVYFFGSSNVVHCADFADLPADQSNLIHNYGFPAANPPEIYHLVRYLVEQEKFLAAGAEKTCAVICLADHDMINDTPFIKGAGGIFPSYLNNSGFYQYDAVKGISLLPMSSWEKSLKLRRAEWRGIAQRIGHMFDRISPMQVDIKAMQSESKRIKALPPEYVPPLQTADLERLLDYLKSHKVNVKLIILPMGSWNAGVTAHERFMSDVPRICAAKDIPLINLANLLRDDQYMDSNHARLEGAVQTRDIFVEVALKFLRHIGALPRDTPPPPRPFP